MTEKELQEMVLTRLDKYFLIEEQVPGKAVINGQSFRYRIDALLTPKDQNGWKNPDVTLGIEFKDPAMGIGAMTRAISQIYDYTYADFRGRRDFPIFLCPPFTHFFSRQYADGPMAKELHAVMARFHGKKLIGELRNEPRMGLDKGRATKGLIFYLNGDHPVWSEARGVMTMGKTSHLVRKYGSGKQHLITQPGESSSDSPSPSNS